MGKPLWHILFVTGIGLLFTVVVFLLFYPVPSPPESEMRDAREALSRARKNEAETYSGDAYRDAIACYDSAMLYWRSENRKFIYKRDYSRVIAFAELSSQRALYSSETSLNTSVNLKINLELELRELDILIEKLRNGFREYPLTAGLRDNISKGKMAAVEARLAFNEKKYLPASEAASRSRSLLSASSDHANSIMLNWFRSYALWEKWIDSTLTASRENNEYSIIVDKFARKFFVYLDGEKICEFTAELGENWIGDKRRRGDKATPEGMYRIVRIIEGDSTSYYKALLLDYPNPEDTLRFSREIEKGTLSRRDSPGDNIQIHGGGGRGADWTSGCIALKDREMDSILKFVREGTPVTIVGSMHKLKYVISK